MSDVGVLFPASCWFSFFFFPLNSPAFQSMCLWDIMHHFPKFPVMTYFGLQCRSSAFHSCLSSCLAVLFFQQSPKKSCLIHPFTTCKFYLLCLTYKYHQPYSSCSSWDLQLFSWFHNSKTVDFLPSLPPLPVLVRRWEPEYAEQIRNTQEKAELQDSFYFFVPLYGCLWKTCCILVWFRPFVFLSFPWNREAGKAVGFHCLPAPLFPRQWVFVLHVNSSSLRQNPRLVSKPSEWAGWQYQQWY